MKQDIIKGLLEDLDLGVYSCDNKLNIPRCAFCRSSSKSPCDMCKFGQVFGECNGALWGWMVCIISRILRKV